jgi:hypothetical protein
VIITSRSLALMLLARVRNGAVLTLIKQSSKHSKLFPTMDASAVALATDNAEITLTDKLCSI